MNKLPLILGLTILYYAILIYWDTKKRKAFKIAQKKVMGATTPLPTFEKEAIPEAIPTEFFGATNMDAIHPIKQQSPTKPEGLFEKLTLPDQHLEKDLEELALDLATEQTIETPKEFQDLAIPSKNELETKAAKISNRKI